MTNPVVLVRHCASVSLHPATFDLPTRHCVEVAEWLRQGRAAGFESVCLDSFLGKVPGAGQSQFTCSMDATALKAQFAELGEVDAALRLFPGHRIAYLGHIRTGGKDLPTIFRNAFALGVFLLDRGFTHAAWDYLSVEAGLPYRTIVDAFAFAGLASITEAMAPRRTHPAIHGSRAWDWLAHIGVMFRSEWLLKTDLLNYRQPRSHPLALSIWTGEAANFPDASKHAAYEAEDAANPRGSEEWIVTKAAQCRAFLTVCAKRGIVPMLSSDWCAGPQKMADLLEPAVS